MSSIRISFLCLTVFAIVLNDVNVNGLMTDGIYFHKSIYPFCYEISKPQKTRPIPIHVAISQNSRSPRNRENQFIYDAFKNGPLSQSVETLISLIEKIEQRFIDLKADELAMMLLRRYRLDDMVWKNTNFAVDQDANFLNKIEDAVLELAGFDLDVDFEKLDNVLNGLENCTMHFLLSHNIDKEALTNEDPKYVFRATPYSVNSSSSKNLNRRLKVDRYSQTNGNNKVTKRPREYGVGSYRSDPEQAIQLSKLLLGVIAGFSSVGSVSFSDVMRKVNPQYHEPNRNTEENLDVLYSLTFTNLISFAAQADSKLSQLLGGSGAWNSTLCTNTYFLNAINSADEDAGLYGTAAETRGAIDGFSIGEILRKLSDHQNFNKQKLKLSQILRYYYSPNGFAGFLQGKHYCDRQNFQLDENEAKKQAVMYQKIVSSTLAGELQQNVIEELVDRVLSELKQQVIFSRRIPNADSQWCQVRRIEGTLENTKCETPMNAIFMIDAENNVDAQIAFIKGIMDNLNLNYGSSISILTNSVNRSSNQGETLNMLAFNSSTVGCALCRVSFSKRDEWISYNKLEPYKLFENLNETLGQFHQPNNPGIASKPFILFNLGFLTDSSVNEWRRFDASKNLLKRWHREVGMFMVHQNTDFTNIDVEGNIELLNGDNRETARAFAEQLCEVPATFQYNECNQSKSKGELHTGYVSKGGIQYWAMYPKYFLKSTRITFNFKAETGKIRFCHSVREKKPETIRDRYDTCKYASEGETVSFYLSNPCEKKDIFTCKPFYFSIAGDRVNEGTNACQNSRCSNLEQLKYTFSHEGISCNSAIGCNLITLSNALLFSFIAILLNNLKNF